MSDVREACEPWCGLNYQNPACPVLYVAQPGRSGSAGAYIDGFQGGPIVWCSALCRDERRSPMTANIPTPQPAPTVSQGTTLTLAHVRPKLARFVLLMEQKLRENDGKGGWGHCSTVYLTRRLIGELKELREAVREEARLRSRWPQDKEAIEALTVTVGREAADVANFAMMLADVCGALR